MGLASRNALVTRTKPGHVWNSSGSGYAPHLARNAAFSGCLYQAAILLYISSNFGAEGSGSARENQRLAGGGGGGCSAVAFCADSLEAQSTHVGRGFFHCFPTNMLRGRAWPQCLHLFCVPDSV